MLYVRERPVTGRVHAFVFMRVGLDGIASLNGTALCGRRVGFTSRTEGVGPEQFAKKPCKRCRTLYESAKMAEAMIK